MKLSVYLFRDDVHSMDGLIQEKYLAPGSYIEIRPKGKLPYECTAYIRTSRPKPPAWSVKLKQHFNLDGFKLFQSSASFILLLKVKGRIFGITFGYGFSAIDRAKLEPRFGLRTALNLLNDQRLNTLDSRNIGEVVRQRRTHVSAGSTLEDFGISVNSEWVRYASGKTKDEEFGSSIAGSEALSLSHDLDPDKLADLCKKLLAKYESTEYAKRFDFLDRMQPLPGTHPLIPELEAAVVEKIVKRSDDKLVIAYPEFVEETLVDRYRVYCGHTQLDMEAVYLKDVFKFLDDNPSVPVSLDQIHIAGLNADGEYATARHRLRDYLVCEVPKGDDIYYLSYGHWHKAAKRFVERVRRQVHAIQDVTDDLKMPAMKFREHEGDYNARVAKGKDWLLLDRKTYQLEGYDKVEICDLLTEDGELIAVKRMRDSANMSHLFAQASVSARLLTGEPEYRNHLAKVAKKKWPKSEFPPHGRLFIYAIPQGKKGGLWREMFLFSQINLIEHARIIQGAGHRVALCKIEYPDA
jgi:uncharacterized protein (TIGR04141 family)